MRGKRRFNWREMAAVRKERGMRQGELAEKIGKARGSISDIETGKLSPKLETVQEIAEALEVTPDSLLLQEIDYDSLDLPPDELSLLLAYRKLPPMAKAAVATAIVSLAESLPPKRG